VILDFRAEQDKLELYSTLILVFYLSYHFIGKKPYFDIFIFKTDYIFRSLYNQFVGLSCYFVSSLWKLLLCYIKSSPKSLLQSGKRNTIEIWTSIQSFFLYHLNPINQHLNIFLSRTNKMKIISINCPALSAILISCCHDREI